MVADVTITDDILQAYVKIRENKKWKKRHCVLQRSSTNWKTAVLQIFTLKNWYRKTGTKNRSVYLSKLCAIESGFSLDGQLKTLAIICSLETAVIAFETDVQLRTWDSWLRCFFGAGSQFSVFALEMPPVLAVLENEYIRVHVRDERVSIISACPPRVSAQFHFSDILRFGPFSNKFCIEAADRTGPLAGVYIFRTGHTDQMTFVFHLASHGRLQNYLVGADQLYNAELNSEFSTPWHFENNEERPISIRFSGTEDDNIFEEIENLKLDDELKVVASKMTVEEMSPDVFEDEMRPLSSSGVSSLRALSSGPRLEGEVFQFPIRPKSHLNYALLDRNPSFPVTPLTAGARWSKSLSTTNLLLPVEYAKIDQLATQAARQAVTTSRLLDSSSQWPSNDSVFESDTAPEPKCTSTLKWRSHFFWRRLRRRSSLVSLIEKSP